MRLWMWTSLLLAVGCGDPAPPASEPPLDERAARDDRTGQTPTRPLPSSRTRLVLLGTGNPNADPERSGPAVAVVVDDVAYVVDAGPGVVRRAQAVANLGVEGLAAERLGIVFLTHLHSDHTVGLPDLIFTPWVLGRDVPLELYGPPGTARMAEHLHEAYAEDIRVRTEGLERASPRGHLVSAHEIDSGLVFEDERVRVHAFEVPHGSWEHALGYRFEGPDRTIVISGDTGPSDAVVQACGGCDVLVHEVYSNARFATRTPAWQAYHARFHTSSRQLGELATRARPGRLVLYHHLLWGAEPDALVAEVASAFDGEIHFGRDLDVL